MDEWIDLISASPPALRVVSRARQYRAAVLARTAAFVCVLLLAIGACSQQPSPNTPIEQTIALASGQSYQLDDGARIEFANVVNDSRCPVGVTCVWAGTATIRLRFRPAGTKSDLDLLAVLPGGVSPDDAASLLPVDTLRYRVTLQRLEPVPTQDVPGGATAGRARATLRVEKSVAP